MELVTLLNRIESLARENGQLESEIAQKSDEIANVKHQAAMASKRIASEYAQEVFSRIMSNPADKIALIKLHRAIFNSGLKEAKDAIEASELYKSARKPEPRIYEVVGEAPWSPPGV